MTNNFARRLEEIVNLKFDGKWARLADAAGLPKTSLQGVKDGADPRWETVRRICEAVHINADWLMTGREPKFRTDLNAASLGEDELYLLEVFRSIPESARASAIASVVRPIEGRDVAVLATEVLSVLSANEAIADSAGSKLTDDSIALIAAHMGAAIEVRASKAGTVGDVKVNSIRLAKDLMKK